MADIEKVLKALDCEEYRKCGECPYVKFGKCNVLLIRDVRELLKEQKQQTIMFVGTQHDIAEATQKCAYIKEPCCLICSQQTCKHWHENKQPEECKSYMRSNLKLVAR